MTGVEIARYAEARALDLAIDAALARRPHAGALLRVWAETQVDAAGVELLAVQAPEGERPRVDPTPVPVPPRAEVDPLDQVLDARTAGDCACEAARAFELPWWLGLRPIVGESVRDILSRAGRAKPPKCVASSGELATWILTSAGLLPAKAAAAAR